MMHHHNTPLTDQVTSLVTERIDRNEAAHRDHTVADPARNYAHGYAEGLRHALAVLRNTELNQAVTQ